MGSVSEGNIGTTVGEYCSEGDTGTSVWEAVVKEMHVVHYGKR
jgi:hypothetical protein